MIIKLSNYDSKYRIVSLAKDSNTKEYLTEQGLATLFLCNNIAHFFPEGTSIKLNSEESEQLNNSSNYDVFEISTTGNAYKCFDNKSLDNAILVTNRCNSNCIMCPTAEIVRKSDEEYTSNELIEIAKHYPDDAPHITITGGEPFLIKKGMFDLLDFLKSNMPRTEFLLLTNGRAFCSKEYVKMFKETVPPNLLLGIPIHGFNAETHDYIVQSIGAFNQTFLGIKHLLSIGAKIELRIVVSKLNADIITDISKLIIKEFQSAYCVKFIGLEMTGNAAKNKNKVWIDYPTAFNKSKEAIDLLIASGIDVGIYNFPLCAVNKKYWNICEKSISDYKIRYAPICDTCQVKDACGGMFSGTIRLAKESIKPILSL